VELYYSFSILIVFSAIFAYLNLRFLRLPSTIGIMVIALICSIVLVTVGSIFPHTLQRFSKLMSNIDFTEVLMGAMLNFLLFAGAVHIRLKDLASQKRPIIVFSTISVVISTLAVGYLLYYATQLLDINISLIECLLFGALISPTDPIAVLGILKQAGVPKSLETKVAGEALFNDGVAIVVFILILNLAQGNAADLSFTGISMLLLQEAVGGIITGFAFGYIASFAIKKIDDYKVEVLITLAVVMGGHLVAQGLHVSGPLAMVSAGLVIGNYGKAYAMSDVSKDYLDKFWELLDEIMNAILFLIIGFELIIIPDIMQYWKLGVLGIVVVLAARFISIWLPSKTIPFREKIDNRTVTMLVWGGLRGGVSVALALSVSSDLHRDLLLSVTYIVVMFSIIVQGLTIGKLTKRVVKQ